MALALLVGPANAGKVARLLDRYLETLDRDPFLIVPNRADVNRVEHDLLARRRALLGGRSERSTTFSGAFDRTRALLSPSGHRCAAVASSRPCCFHTTSTVSLPRRVIRGLPTRSGSAVADLEAALLEPAISTGSSPISTGATGRSSIVSGFRTASWHEHAPPTWSRASSAPGLGAGLRLRLRGPHGLAVAAARGARRARGCRRLASLRVPCAPHSARSSAPRTTWRVFAGDESSRSPQGVVRQPALAPPGAHALRGARTDPPPLEGAVRFLEAAERAPPLELVGRGDPHAHPRRACPPTEIAVVVPVSTAFARRSRPRSAPSGFRIVRGPDLAEATPFGQALGCCVSPARWRPPRPVHVPAFSVLRASRALRADFVEGGSAGAGSKTRRRCRGSRAAARPLGARPARAPGRGGSARRRACACPPDDHGRLRPRVAAGRRDVAIDLRAHEAALGLLDELEGWRKLGGRPRRSRSSPPSSGPRCDRGYGGARPGGGSRPHARPDEALASVFILGLEEGSSRAGSTETPFLRTRRGASSRPPARAGGSCARPARPRALPLLHGLHAGLAPARPRPRRRLTTTGGHGSPARSTRKVRSRFDPADVARATKKRPLSSLSWELERGPTERERLRAAAAIASTDEDEARALAIANGWERPDRARALAFDRRTVLAHPLVLEELASARASPSPSSSASWSAPRCGSSSASSIPKEIDAGLDARVRGGHRAPGALPLLQRAPQAVRRRCGRAGAPG
jgi:hypothetical protein